MANLINLIPTVMSASLLEDNIEFTEKKNKKSKDFVKQGVKNILGVSLVSSVAKSI